MPTCLWHYFYKYSFPVKHLSILLNWRPGKRTTSMWDVCSCVTTRASTQTQACWFQPSAYWDVLFSSHRKQKGKWVHCNHLYLMLPTASAPGFPTANFIDYSITEHHLRFRMMEKNALQRFRSAMPAPAPPRPASCHSTAAAKGT